MLATSTIEPQGTEFGLLYNFWKPQPDDYGFLLLFTKTEKDISTLVTSSS